MSKPSINKELSSNVMLDITQFLSPVNQGSLSATSKTTKSVINKSIPGLLINLIKKNSYLYTDFEKDYIEDLVKEYNNGKVEGLENNFSWNTPEKNEQFKEIKKTYYNLLKLLNSDVVLIMGGEGTNIVTKMIIDQDGTIRFEDGVAMLHARYYHDVIYNQGKVFSLSINADDEYFGTMEIFDTLTKVQVQLQTNLQTISTSHYFSACLAMLNNILYLIDGYRNMYILEKQGVWQNQNTCTIIIRRHASVIAYEGKLYICGGINERSVEIFDPAIGMWQLDYEEMTKTRSYFSLYVFEDEIYAVGGDEYNQNTTIEKRNKDTQIWELVADCGQNRCGCTTVLAGLKIFLFGGREHKSTFDYFDLKSKKWASQDITSAYFDIGERQLPREVVGSKAVFIPKISLSGGSLLSSNYDLNQKLIKNKIKEINNKLLNFKGTLKKINSKNIKYVKKKDNMMIKYSYTKK
jgi:hypothetical protein